MSSAGSVLPCSVCGTLHDSAEACPSARGARVGTVLEGKYELVRSLGQGGMGEVYEGRHRVLGRRVAVKFLLAEHTRNPQVALRFENEARTAGATEHENIGAVHDVGALPDGTRYLIMEFLDGEDVDQLVQRAAPLPISRATFIVIQVCRALDVVHRRGIVHRDLKPSNLFLSKRADKTDLVKVIDFGIAKHTSGQPGDLATKTGAAIGTAHYMSPEQARGERTVDSRSDIYALGVILYELLSGKKPHEGDSLLQILHKVMTQLPVPLETARPGLPAGVYDVVRRAMARDPADRFETVADLGDALLPFVGRPLAPIHSQAGVAAAPRAIDSGGTQTSADSTADPRAPRPGLASMVGVVRSDLGAARPGAKGHGRAILIAGIAALAVTAGVASAVAVTRAGPLGASSAAGSSQVRPPPPGATTTAPPVAESSPPVASEVMAAVAPASHSPSTVVTARPNARPTGHRTVSEQSPAASSGPAPARAAPAPPPPSPPVRDRGSNPF